MSRDEQKVTHLHYHYHYNMQSAHGQHPVPLAHTRAMAKSQLLPTRNYAEKEEVNGSEHGQQREGELGGRERERSFKKLKISDCWSTQNSSGVVDKRSLMTQAPEIRSFNVQEEHLSADEDGPSSLSHHFQHVKLPFQTDHARQYEKGLIAKYQSELAWYRKEIERLLRVEEECIFLRASYLEHFQSCQRRKESSLPTP